MGSAISCIWAGTTLAYLPRLASCMDRTALVLLDRTSLLIIMVKELVVNFGTNHKRVMRSSILSDGSDCQDLIKSLFSNGILTPGLYS